MILRLRLHLLPARGRAFHFLLRPGSVILQLVVPLVTVTADSPAAFPRLATAMETGSRQVLAAAVGSVGFAAGSVVAAVGLSVAVDSAATVFVAAGPDFAVDLACSVVGSVCSFAAETGKGRVVVAISCSLIPRSSF